jgi:CRISPR type III-B/RAMP module RAMP protein Cmr6
MRLHGRSGGGGGVRNAPASGRSGPGGPPAPQSGRRAMRASINTLLDDRSILQSLSPGFYFQRCLAMWQADLRDTVKNKGQALKPLQGWHDAAEGPIRGDLDLHRGVLARQQATFEMLRDRGAAISVPLRNLTPFVTGIGQPHPLGNGFAFLKPYGVPYLAGSGVKGAVRASCAELWLEQVGPEESDARLEHYFGSRDKDMRPGLTADHRRGSLVFFDLLPRCDGDKGWAGAFRVDVVNPHYAPYYQGAAVPADWHAPMLNYFITLREGLEWRLHVVYAPPPGERRAAWQEEVLSGITAALTLRGLGAKKSWSYGLFEVIEDMASPGPGRPQRIQQARRASPAAGSLRQLVAGLKQREVRSQFDRIRRDLALCTLEEQAEIRGLIEARLGVLGLKAREVREVIGRLFPETSGG